MGSQEPLRKAIAWLLAQRKVSAELIEQASRRFDLSPLDEAFLREYFIYSASNKLKKHHYDDLGSS